MKLKTTLSSEQKQVQQRNRDVSDMEGRGVGLDIMRNEVKSVWKRGLCNGGRSGSVKLPEKNPGSIR